MNDTVHHHSDANQPAQNAEQTAGATALTPEQKSHLHQQIVARYDNKVDTKDFKFSFKTDKELGTKRATVELKLPVLNIAGIIAILENADGKQDKAQELLLESLQDVVYAQARSIVNDDEAISQENFPLDKVTWEYISNMPKAERRGGGIAKETWEEFAKDYIEVMPAATNKKLEQVGLAAKLLVAKFGPIRTQKQVIQMLQGQLGIYTNVSPNAEQFVDCIDFLNKKAETLLNLSEADLLANL